MGPNPVRLLSHNKITWRQTRRENIMKPQKQRLEENSYQPRISKDPCLPQKAWKRLGRFCPESETETGPALGLLTFRVVRETIMIA